MHCQFSVQESLQNCLGHNLVKEKFIKIYVPPQSEYFAENNVWYHPDCVQCIFQIQILF